MRMRIINKELKMATSMSYSDNCMRKSGRKRHCYEDDWVKKKRKPNKDAGKEYEMYKGKPKPAKQVLAITCRCGLKCWEKINPVDRTCIFDEFYKLKSHDAQNKYLYGLIEKEEVKPRRADRDSGPRRKVTYQYYVHCTNGNRCRVCRKSFCAVHSIGKKTSGVVM